MQKEAKARIKINQLLEQAGWFLIDGDGHKANVQLETRVKITDLGDDYEHVTHGAIDYLLLDEHNFPVCVLEAKSEDKDPLVGKEQARQYAAGKNVRYILLSNGNLHYLWDREQGNPTRISFFPTLKTLRAHQSFAPDPRRIVDEKVNADYVVLTQNPNYQRDPRWEGGEAQRDELILQGGLKFLRPYQLDAIHAVQNAVGEGKNRFLLEMATGTGKTLVAAGIIKLYLRSGNARRVLFLVDRLELENQAKKAFDRYLRPDFRSVIFKENRDDWNHTEIVITTIQSISYENKYLKLFAPTDFDLIISDEAHRSISGDNRTIFEYFLGAKLGLTATPRDYLKNLKAAESDPRELERRILLSTYQTFGCESGQPTFRYSLPDGVRDGCLVNPKAIDCRTEITTQLLSDRGYAVMVAAEDEESVEQVFHQGDFERHFFSEKTNIQFCRVFMDNALRDPLSGEIGKSIVFCVSRRHAAKIAQILNEMAHILYPGKYNSDFAMQVTSDVMGAQSMTTNFANNNLSGSTRFLPGYRSAKTRVCCTVGMMTTGYDCEDLLNLCLMRPIFSPTDFVQIKGRGTRRFTFRHTFEGDGKRETVEKEKNGYHLFDFFANCDYFEKHYPYDKVIELPPYRQMAEGEVFPPLAAAEKNVTLAIPDPLKTMEVLRFDGDIMRVDRELYINRFETKVKETYQTNPQFKEALDNGDRETAEQTLRELVFNKPEDFFSLDSVRRGYQADRRLNLWEILDKIFGRIPRFRSRAELALDEFERYSLAHPVEPKLYYQNREFFTQYLTDEEFRLVVNQRQYNKLAANPPLMEMLTALGRERIERLSGYIKDHVALNAFST